MTKRDPHHRYISTGLARQSYGCTCSDRTGWYVNVLKGNSSAFNGYRWTPSDYSEVRCSLCGRRWRTKAKYVDTLPVYASNLGIPPEVWLAEQFEFETCSECGGDVDDHEAIPVLGNWFARCKREEVVASTPDPQ